MFRIIYYGSDKGILGVVNVDIDVYTCAHNYSIASRRQFDNYLD